MNELTRKQQRFVDEYMVDLNATQAAVRAGYSEKTSQEQAYQLLQKTSVQNAVTTQLDKIRYNVNLEAEYVIQGLMREAENFSVDASSTSRIQALVWLGKYLKMFTDKVNDKGVRISVVTGVPDSTTSP